MLNEPGGPQDVTALILILAIIILAIPQAVWPYWSAAREKRQRRSQATPKVVRLPVGLERKNQAIRVRAMEKRFPLRGIDKFIAKFLQGGAISGF